jgi:hypothetical protein
VESDGSKRRALAGHYLCWVDRFGGSHTALIGQMNQPGARRAPVALAA